MKKLINGVRRDVDADGNVIKTLKEVIESLDPAIDAHWTKGDKPDLNAVSELMGHRITRKQADRAKPDFYRPDI